jgi:ribonucleoside-diphosphate reductase alpha chain
MNKQMYDKQEGGRAVPCNSGHTDTSSMTVTASNGTSMPFDVMRLKDVIAWLMRGYERSISTDLIMQEIERTIYVGISTTQLHEALLLSIAAFIEYDPDYSTVAARCLHKKLFKEVTGKSIRSCAYEHEYKNAFINGIMIGVKKELLDQRVELFDLHELANHLSLDRDDYFEYMGLRTLYERYFLRSEKVLELPQAFWMRIAMGMSLEEENRTQRAIEFYNLMSTLRYIPSTPTLLHAALVRPQLSSCYLTTVEDDLHHIFKCLGDNAQLSKWSGGLANDWTNVRAVGSYIKTIKVESQGVVPFLRIANDVTAAINRSGKRRSACVVYLETWHLEVEDFLDLRRNTGDERRRTHDINTANWIPDLFFKRVLEDGPWTLFSPEEVPDLHHIYGRKFEERYVEYEQLAQEGKIELFKVIEAKKLWRKMLSRLFETGHPWLTFKDPCNIRSPQDHAGVVHSSNLCTEITLNTSAEETAVCNLGSINIGKHIRNGILDKALLAESVTIAMRMLDNIIDINFYPTKEARHANMLHRPVGLGQMGLQDALYLLDITFDSPDALQFADEASEMISHAAILASSHLAKERGTYASYQGSKWSRNILPHDTIALLEEERGMKIDIPKNTRLDWDMVRNHIKQHGMRNSNCMAIAPTATIANIAGCLPCIEPIYKNLYVKSNMSGEFTVVNKYLIEDLKKLDLWNQDMLEQIKYYDGSVQMIEEIPQYIRDKYKEAFELDAEWMIDISAARGRWIDQSQSHNVFMKGVSGTKLHDIYMRAWQKGLKTTYYLRTLGASQIEKSTLDAKKFGFTQKRVYKSAADETPSLAQARGVAEQPDISNKTDMIFTSTRVQLAANGNGSILNNSMQMMSEDDITNVQACSIENPECDVCQ